MHQNRCHNEGYDRHSKLSLAGNRSNKASHKINEPTRLYEELMLVIMALHHFQMVVQLDPVRLVGI